MSYRYRNIARVVRPHGRRGEVVVAELRGLPFLLQEGMEVALTPPALDRDRFVRVESVNVQGADALVSFSGIDSLAAAEGVSGCTVLAHEDDLDLEALDVAVDDVLGRTVVDERYGELGLIEEVMLTPANDVWVVNGPFGEVLLPVIEQVVACVPEEGPIPVRIMDGLIDDAPHPDCPRA